ncbi:MAG: 50S ribosomal protein L17 [Candidatus Wildermuthbacteria bacterium]|nr:50S ribosomal protein L17 [Candidatus Wildermuthbacteria bacterium]
MQKRVAGRKLSREKAQRTALLRSLARALVEQEKIKTTLAKAKTLAPLVEKLVTRAKRGDVVARREMVRALGAELGKKMMVTIAPSFKTRNGGYTRVVKLEKKKENSADMAVIEFMK